MNYTQFVSVLYREKGVDMNETFNELFAVVDGYRNEVKLIPSDAVQLRIVRKELELLQKESANKSNQLALYIKLDEWSEKAKLFIKKSTAHENARDYDKEDFLEPLKEIRKKIQSQIFHLKMQDDGLSQFNSELDKMISVGKKSKQEILDDSEFDEILNRDFEELKAKKERMSEISREIPRLQKNIEELEKQRKELVDRFEGLSKSFLRTIDLRNLKQLKSDESVDVEKINRLEKNYRESCRANDAQAKKQILEEAAGKRGSDALFKTRASERQKTIGQYYDVRIECEKLKSELDSHLFGTQKGALSFLVKSGVIAEKDSEELLRTVKDLAANKDELSESKQTLSEYEQELNPSQNTRRTPRGVGSD